jgi:hypothetical protein
MTHDQARRYRRELASSLMAANPRRYTTLANTNAAPTSGPPWRAASNRMHSQWPGRSGIQRVVVASALAEDSGLEAY